MQVRPWSSSKCLLRGLPARQREAFHFCCNFEGLDVAETRPAMVARSMCKDALFGAGAFAREQLGEFGMKEHTPDSGQSPLRRAAASCSWKRRCHG